jgi:hypothetical protein
MCCSAVGCVVGLAQHHYCWYVASIHPKHGMSVCMYGMLARLVMLMNTLSLDFQLRETETSVQKIIDLKFYVTSTL